MEHNIGDLVYFRAIDEEKRDFSNIHYFKEGIGVIIGFRDSRVPIVWSHKYGKIDAMVISPTQEMINCSIQKLRGEYN